MAGRPRRNLIRGPSNANKETSNPIPAEMEPSRVLGTFLPRLERLGNSHNNNNGNNDEAPPRPVGDKLVERFRGMRLDKFNGLTKLWEAEEWL